MTNLGWWGNVGDPIRPPRSWRPRRSDRTPRPVGPQLSPRWHHYPI